jgi:hypothetical protein
MKKIYFLIFIFFTILSCKENRKTIDFKKYLNGKTFNVNNSSNFEQDIEFYDSTAITYSLRLFESKYRIKNVNDSIGKIFFGNEPALIKLSNSNDYDFIITGERLKDTLLLKEIGVKYDKKDIAGYWKETSNQYYKINLQSITKELNDSIVKESKLRFDASNKYLNFKLPENSERTELLWKILKIENDTLFIDKSFKTKDGWTTLNNIKLIKKH